VLVDDLVHPGVLAHARTARIIHVGKRSRRHAFPQELATNILIAPLRANAALVAKQVAQVDVLSGGRMRLGVGIGWNWVEYEVLGVPFKARGARQAEQIRLLLMEVNHRSKNMLTTIQALARRSAPNDEGFLARFEDRVQSLALNQDILVGREWREVPIDELIRLQLAFVHDAPGTFRLGGPPLSLAPRAAEVVGMAIHELATNSLKYGALSAEGGSVDIGWSHRPDGTGLMLWWRESGGPPVIVPKHKGFGTTLIRDVPQHNLGAEVSLNFNPGGVCWEMTCDPSALAEAETLVN